MPEGFNQLKFYPVEGDSAIVELYVDDEQWAGVELDQIDLQAEGEARVANVKVIVHILPPSDAGKRSWAFDLREVVSQLRRAEEWLLDNERGRTPLAG